MTIWLDNPGKRRKGKGSKRRRRGRLRKGSKAAKRYMARIRNLRKKGTTVARKRRKHRTSSTTRRRRRHAVKRYSRRGGSVRAHMSNPHRRRRHRRNPGFGSARGIFGKAMTGAKNGAFVFAGKAATGLITGFIPLTNTGPIGILVRSAAAVLAGIGLGFISPQAGVFGMAGGFASVYEAIAKGFNLPLVTGALSTAEMPLGLAPLASTGAASYVGTGSYVGDPSDLFSRGTGLGAMASMF